MQFFVPNPATDDVEEDYQQLATAAKVQPDPADSRVYELIWIHDGETWRARVGETLRGWVTEKRKGSTGRGNRRWLSTSLTVKAIFAPKLEGLPYVVMLDAPLGNTKDRWRNPILTSKKPESVIYFDAPEVAATSEDA